MLRVEPLSSNVIQTLTAIYFALGSPPVFTPWQMNQTSTPSLSLVIAMFVPPRSIPTPPLITNVTGQASCPGRYSIPPCPDHWSNALEARDTNLAHPGWSMTWGKCVSRQHLGESLGTSGREWLGSRFGWYKSCAVTQKLFCCESRTLFSDKVPASGWETP